MKRFALLLLVLPSAASATAYPKWTVGQEREIDAGTYAKLLSQNAGWRVWRFETRSGVTCRAVKSAIGRIHPYPIGVGSKLVDGTPFIEADSYKQGSLSVTISGTWGGGKWEFRKPGARFWSSADTAMPVAEWDGQKIEVHIQTWEYDEILVGLSDERAIVDLTGAAAAVREVESCISGGGNAQ